MPRATVPRTARIEARIAPEALDMVRRAAELEGRSVSDFIVAEALLDPPALAPAMKRAMQARRRLIDTTR